jgi:hypothetical protein
MLHLIFCSLLLSYVVEITNKCGLRRNSNLIRMISFISMLTITCSWMMATCRWVAPGVNIMLMLLIFCPDELNGLINSKS